MNREAVRWAYRLFLNREPENDDVLNAFAGNVSSYAELKKKFLNCDEYRNKNSLPLSGMEPLALSECNQAILCEGVRQEQVRQKSAKPSSDVALDLLQQINKDLPTGIDWKAGAIDYLANLFYSPMGKENKNYHYLKPFNGGPDFSSFFAEMYGFLNAIEKLKLPMQANVLDVGCGPGWTSHYLAKLGHNVCGIDISPICIEISTNRILSEPYCVYGDTPLSAKFILHDVETGPIDDSVKYDVALFESTLHHFYNPVAVLNNVKNSLADDGLICVWEGAARDGSLPFSDEQLKIMKKYHTLERPYTRSQVIELLRITGFNYYEFYSQVNGYFNVNNNEDLSKLKGQLAAGNDWNIFIASRTDTFFTKT